VLLLCSGTRKTARHEAVELGGCQAWWHAKPGVPLKASKGWREQGMVRRMHCRLGLWYRGAKGVKGMH
jgi:hypothetical protein